MRLLNNTTSAVRGKTEMSRRELSRRELEYVNRLYDVLTEYFKATGGDVQNDSENLGAVAWYRANKELF